MARTNRNRTNWNTKIAELLLTTGIPVYHDNAPEDGSYPLIQYSTLSDRPVLHADNKTRGYEAVFRITLINNTPVGREVFKAQVIEIMENAGFMWQNTATTRDKNEYYTSIDFSVGEEL